MKLRAYIFALAVYLILSGDITILQLLEIVGGALIVTLLWMSVRDYVFKETHSDKDKKRND